MSWVPASTCIEPYVFPVLESVTVADESLATRPENAYVGLSDVAELVPSYSFTVPVALEMEFVKALAVMCPEEVRDTAVSE